MKMTKAKNKLKFDHRLVLANWMLSLFGVATFENLGKHMYDPASEGFDEDGISHFHPCVKLLFDRPELPNDILLAYDGNIVRHWKRITSKEKRRWTESVPQVLPVSLFALHGNLPGSLLP